MSSTTTMSPTLATLPSDLLFLNIIRPYLKRDYKSVLKCKRLSKDMAQVLQRIVIGRVRDDEPGDMFASSRICLVDCAPKSDGSYTAFILATLKFDD